MHFTYEKKFFKRCPDVLIKSAPYENVTVPLGQTTAVNFSCDADGDFVLWVINGTYVHLQDEESSIYEDRGVTFYRVVHTSGVIISMGINITTARNNNTKLYCSAAAIGMPIETSIMVTLTIAGTVMIGIWTLTIHGQNCSIF